MGRGVVSTESIFQCKSIQVSARSPSHTKLTALPLQTIDTAARLSHTTTGRLANVGLYQYSNRFAY